MANPTYRSAGTAAGTSTGALSLAMPAGTVDNDIMVAAIVSDDIILATSAGWTSLGKVTATSASFSTQLLWKRATSESGSNYSFARAGSNNSRGQIISIVGADTSASVINAQTTLASSATGTLVTSTPCTSTVAQVLFLFVVGTDSNTVTIASQAGGGLTWTEQVDAGDATSGVSLSFTTAPQAAAGAVSPTGTLSGSTSWAGFTLAIAPAAGAVTPSYAQLQGPGPGVSPNSRLQFQTPPRSTYVLPPVGAISGTTSISFGGSSSISGPGVLVGTGGIVFGGAGTLLVPLSLGLIPSPVTGLGGPFNLNQFQAFRTFSSDARGITTGALAGTASLSFSQAGAISGPGTLGGTSALVFGQSGNVGALGTLAGTTTLTFGSTAGLSGPGTLSGALALVFGQSGTLVPPDGSLAGTTGLTLGGSGTIVGVGVLGGSASLLFGQAGSLAGTGALVGAATLVFGSTTANLRDLNAVVTMRVWIGRGSVTGQGMRTFIK